MEIDKSKLGRIESLNEHCKVEKGCMVCSKRRLCDEICHEIAPEEVLKSIYSVMK